MIVFFGILVLNDGISKRFFCHIFKVFIFWTVRGVKGKIIAQNENNNYICLAPYLWNNIVDDHDF